MARFRIKSRDGKKKIWKQEGSSTNVSHLGSFGVVFQSLIYVLMYCAHAKMHFARRVIQAKGIY